MTISHVNRHGATYYLHEGKTKTGKPKWHFSKKASGGTESRIPDGHEIFEDHRGQPHVRPIKPKLIRPEEIAMIEKTIRETTRLRHFLVQDDEEKIIVYTPSQSPSAIDEMIGEFGFMGTQALRDKFEKRSPLAPMMRFTLDDSGDKRRFGVERWCFRGSIDGWFHLSGGSLDAVARKYLPHLDKESFFELM